MLVRWTQALVSRQGEGSRLPLKLLLLLLLPPSTECGALGQHWPVAESNILRALAVCDWVLVQASSSPRFRFRYRLWLMKGIYRWRPSGWLG